MTDRGPRLGIHQSPFDTLVEKDARFVVANDAYYALLERGPIGALFRDEMTRFGASKGGSHPQFAIFHDQTHFQHGLNAATAAGILFCAGLHEHGETVTVEEVRAVLSAGALHDFDKIVDGRYPQCLVDHDKRFVELLGDLPESLHDSVRHLILATEDGTDGDASQYSCVLTGNVRKLAIAALAAGDTLSTTSREFQPDDVEAYRAILAKLRTKHGANLLPTVHVLGICDVPQTALVATVRQALLDWIRENGLLLHDSPRRVSWIGPEWHDSVARDLAGRVRGILQVPFRDFAEGIKIHAGSGSIPTDWVNAYPPSRETVLDLIDVKKHQLVFWGGDWGPKHLARLRKKAPCFHHATKTDKTDTVRVELPEDDGTPTGRRARLQAQIILASALVHNVTGDVSTSHPDPRSWDIEEAEPKSRKFVAGILDVIEVEPTEVLLHERLDACVKALDAKRDPSADDGLAAVVARILGQAAELPEPGPTAAACVVCGTSSSVPLDAQKAEGMKPSGWLPRSAAIQAQKDDAKICAPCTLDSLRRTQIVRDSMVKGAKEAQYFHVHRSDTAVEGKLLNLIREVDPKRPAADGRGVTIYARGKADEPTIPHDNHVTVPIPANGNTEEQVGCLDNILSFCYSTGHKVQVTSLGGIPRLHACMIHWQNAPSWVRDLRPRDQHGAWPEGLAAVRCDRVPAARTIVRSIRKAAFVNRTGANVAYSPILNTLVSNPLGLYRFPCRAGKDDADDPTTILERYFMDNETVQLLEKAGHAFCKFNTRDASAWGKSNHWQWATRSTIRALEKKDDLKSAAARGLLHNEAQRKFEGARAEDIDAFVTSIETLHRKHGAGNDQVARDLIAAVEWTAERLYHQHYSRKAREGGNDA